MTTDTNSPRPPRPDYLLHVHDDSNFLSEAAAVDQLLIIIFIIQPVSRHSGEKAPISIYHLSVTSGLFHLELLLPHLHFLMSSNWFYYGPNQHFIYLWLFLLWPHHSRANWLWLRLTLNLRRVCKHRVMVEVQVGKLVTYLSLFHLSLSEILPFVGRPLPNNLCNLVHLTKEEEKNRYEYGGSASLERHK